MDEEHAAAVGKLVAEHQADRALLIGHRQFDPVVLAGQFHPSPVGGGTACTCTEGCCRQSAQQQQGKRANPRHGQAPIVVPSTIDQVPPTVKGRNFHQPLPKRGEGVHNARPATERPATPATAGTKNGFTRC